MNCEPAALLLCTESWEKVLCVFHASASQMMLWLAACAVQHQNEGKVDNCGVQSVVYMNRIVRGSYLGSCQVLIEAQPGPCEWFVLLWQLHHQRHPTVFIYWHYYGALPLPIRQVLVTRRRNNPWACFSFFTFEDFLEIFLCCSGARVDLRAWREGSWSWSASYPSGSHKVILFIWTCCFQ